MRAPSWGDHDLEVILSGPADPTRVAVKCGVCGAVARAAHGRGAGTAYARAMGVFMSLNVPSCRSNSALILTREVMEM